ncbi:MAG: helix-turn-helix domain-containing protein [Caecibacter massiliensis]|nr:helix-turn-helix domain-containing protein [Caecibacter massiliensis]
MGVTLKAARVNKNLTQKKAAALLGISVETLINYEKGLSFPNVPIIKKIEKVYEVRYSDINFLT